MQAPSETQSDVSVLPHTWPFMAPMLLASITFTMFLNVLPLSAQQEITGPVGSSVNRPSNSSNVERVLVLRTGRVMKGRIKKISTGWLVSTDRGSAVIPFAQVHFDADDLNEAYLRLRIQNGRPTVATHLRLAEWCLSQGILAEAARELRDALEKDPANETARLMLNRVNTEIRRRTPQEPASDPVQDVVILTEQETSKEEPEVRSLSGLSPETAREFVASIQPLLLNKCGNARCHGSAGRTEFRLTRIRAGANNSRVVSEKNLAAVLDDLRPGQNGQVRLLKIVRGSHAGRTIFNGRYGAAQMQTLQQWARTVAKELNFESELIDQAAFSNRSTGSRRVVASADLSRSSDAEALPEAPAGTDQSESELSDPSRTSSDYQARNAAILSSESSSSPVPLTNVQQLLQEAREHVRKQDEFDPEDFNRRFAGRRTP